MLNLLKQDAKVGDTLNLYLTSGNSVKGTIIEIDENYLLMEVDGVKRRYFPQLIGGWDVVPNDETTSIGGGSATDSDTKEDEEETNEFELNDVLLSLFDKIYETENIDLNKTILTNAKVEKVIATGVSVITDSGDSFICHKGFMAGYSRANCTPGKRLFCGLPNNSGPQKGICYQSVLETNFKELRERFILALSAKPVPRRPIINSIIAYFRKNNSGRLTKKAISELRTKLKNLGNSDKKDGSQIELYISQKKYDNAFELIEREITSAADDKQKSALLLRKAQLYSSIKEHENAISAYRELISFNEKTNAPNKNLSHLYTELSRLLLLVGDKEQAEGARNIALMLNPMNSIARKMNGLGDSLDDSAEKISETIDQESNDNILGGQIVKFVDGSLIDDDIDRHTFVDSEIVSLNGEVSNNIVNRLLDNASSSNDFNLHLETAKALKSLPIGSYDIQDLEDSITNYSICKCRSLFNSYKKVVFESDSIKGISIEQLNRIKDCAISYSLETIENVIDEDDDTATNLLLNCLLLELSSLYITQKKSKVSILDILDFSLESLITFITNQKEKLIVASLFVKLVDYSLQCQNLWEKLVLSSKILNTYVLYVKEDDEIKKNIISLTPPLKKRDVEDFKFVEILRRHELNRVKVSIQQLRKIRNIEVDISSINLLNKRVSQIVGEKRLRFFCDTDRKSLEDINHLVSLLKLYQNKNKDERKDILSNVFLELDEVLKWNTGATATKIGRFYFFPLLLSWKKSLSKLNVQDEYNDSCLLSLEVDSPYYTVNDENIKYFNIVLFNKGARISEGYKLAIWIDDKKKDIIYKSDDRYILLNSSVSLEIQIPCEKWGNLNIYELNFAINSRYQGKWSTTQITTASITYKRDVSFSKPLIKWKDSGNPPKELFKGRDDIVNDLKEHYCSPERRYSYVLYGLSRTGKSSILDYLQKSIEGCEIIGNTSTKIVLPLYIDLGDIYGNKIDNDFWAEFVNTIYGETVKFVSEYKPDKVDGIVKPSNLKQYITDMNELQIHPLFMFDEFSFMQDIIDDGFINSAFLQYMRTISADKDLASFIFAGTYDIKQLIHDQKYNISGAFTYLREPDKPIFEISAQAAEELINVMQGKLDFSPAAIRKIHRLTGDVPFWIQKLCLNCGIFAVETNNSFIGVSELEKVVSKMTGESNKIGSKTDIPTMNRGTFEKTQLLKTDTEEMKIVLTSISYLVKEKEPESLEGITYDEIKALWSDNGCDISNYNIKEAIDSLCERKTLTYEDIENMRYYRFSIDLFRRWWLHEHFVFELELSTFKKNVKYEV